MWTYCVSLPREHERMPTLSDKGSHLDHPLTPLSFMLQCPYLVACNNKAAQTEGYRMKKTTQL